MFRMGVIEESYRASGQVSNGVEILFYLHNKYQEC